MLYIGEKVGNKNGPELDIAVDPLEGTNFAANNLPGALSVIAISEKNNLLNAPETYMEKISTRVAEKNVVDLDYSVKKNIFNLSEYLNKKPENLTACILKRPRHNKIVTELRDLNVKIKFISEFFDNKLLLVEVIEIILIFSFLLKLIKSDNSWDSPELDKIIKISFFSIIPISPWLASTGFK